MTAASRRKAALVPATAGHGTLCHHCREVVIGGDMRAVPFVKRHPNGARTTYHHYYCPDCLTVLGKEAAS